MFNKEDIKILEFQELQAELMAVKQLVDLKDQSISKLKEDLRACQVLNTKAVGEQRFLQEEILLLQKEQERTLEDYEKVLDKVEVLTADRNEKSQIIEILEDKNKLLDSPLAETKSMIIQIQHELNDKRTRENDGNYEIKVLSNQVSLLQAQEDEMIRDNKELRILNEDLMEKLKSLNEEVSVLMGRNKEQEKTIEEFTGELKDYDDILADFKGYKESNRKDKEEKERGILKIKELIVRNDEKERIIERKEKEICEMRGLVEDKERRVSEIMAIAQEEKRSYDLKDRKIKELVDKVELLEFKQMEVKEYLGRKADRMKARFEAELSLVHSMKLQV